MRILTVGECIDNTGVKKVKVIKVYGYTNKKEAKIGDKVCVVVKRSVLNIKDIKDARRKRRFRVGSILRAVVVQDRRRYFRSNRTWIYFNRIAVVLVTKNGYPLAKKIKGCVPREVALKYPKFASICYRIV